MRPQVVGRDLDDFAVTPDVDGQALPSVFDNNLLHSAISARCSSGRLKPQKDAAVLVCFADDLKRGCHRATRWIGHPHPQITAIALAKKK